MKKIILAIIVGMFLISCVVGYTLISDRYIEEDLELNLNTSFIYDLNITGFVPITYNVDSEILKEWKTGFGINVEQAEILLESYKISPTLFIKYKEGILDEFYDDKLIIPMLNEMKVLKEENQEQQIHIDAMRKALCNLGQTQFCKVVSPIK